jgi:hypothetical protein
MVKEGQAFHFRTIFTQTELSPIHKHLHVLLLSETQPKIIDFWSETLGSIVARTQILNAENNSPVNRSILTSQTKAHDVKNITYSNKLFL